MRIKRLDSKIVGWPLIGGLAGVACLGILLIHRVSAQPSGEVWLTEGFEAFRQGQFDAGGTNLYVSHNGIVQTVHRFDVNNDNYYDLPFANTHDRTHRKPIYQYHFGSSTRNAPQLTELPANGSTVVRVADLNSDGMADLLVGPSDGNEGAVHNSWIYWGTANGWTELRHMELVTPNVADVCIGDLNGDSRPDLVFVAPGGQGYAPSRIYWSNKDLYSYADFTILAVPRAAGCLIGDFDADGKNDLLLLTGGTGSRVYWGAGKRLNPKDATPFPVSDGNAAISIGSRIAVAAKTGVSLFRAHKRTFTVDEAIKLPGAARLAAADLNSDGSPELVVVQRSTTSASITKSILLWGRKSAADVTYGQVPPAELATNDAADVAIGDVDRDGFPDLVFANSRDGESYNTVSFIYWGSAEGYAVGRRAELKTHGAASVAVSGPNVIFANSVDARRRGDVDSYIYLGSANGQYSPSRRVDLPTVGAYETCMSDLDDDGYVDVVIVNSHEDAGSAEGVGSYIFWGQQDGVSPLRKTAVPSRAGIGCAVADVNRDGYLDLLVANLADNTISLFFGGEGRFEPAKEQIIKARDARFPLIADLNKDGWLDMVVPSVKDGLYIFWGSASGYREDDKVILPGVGAVSEQIADIDRDGWLDIVVNNLFDEPNRAYQGINTYVYWGSSAGYSPMRRMDLPSQGGEHSTIADFNRDGFLDVFISNYDSEFTRDLDSHIYWGSAGGLSHRRRTALHVGSASGAASADLNGDGWVDLVVANHFQNGSHRTDSVIFWNAPNGFQQERRTSLPTIGAHMMNGVDQGNVYDRAFRETYVSAIHRTAGPVTPASLSWEGTTPFDSKIEFELRGASSAAAITGSAWQHLGNAGDADRTVPVSAVPAHEFWQYRVTLRDGRASSPTLKRFKLLFHTR